MRRPDAQGTEARRERSLLLAEAAARPSDARRDIGFFLRLGSDFLPSLDERALMLQSKLPSETSLAAVDEANFRLEARLMEIPGVETVYRRTGRGEVAEDPMPHTLSDVLVVLERGADTKAVERIVAKRVEDLPFPVEITTPMQMRIAEGIGGTPADVQVKLFHPDLDLLEAALPRLQERLSRLRPPRSRV